MPTTIQIANRTIGPGHPVFFIAEAGVNHNGSADLAHRLIDVAADAGADAVKFQTFDPDLLASEQAPKAAYQETNTGRGGSQLDMLRELRLPESIHHDLAEHARERGILFLSTPFDPASAEFLHRLDLPAFKISSGDLTNHPLLLQIAAFGKPIILSTGMATLDEVAAAIRALTQTGFNNIALLHCVSCYPAEPAECNLAAMHTLAQQFQVPCGFSDHTLGSTIALAAVARGACIIEKHFTLDRALPGPDHRASLEPAELRQLAIDIRQVQLAVGNGVKQPCPRERNTAAVARKSLTAARDLSAGAVLSQYDLTIQRPGTGIPPAELSDTLGRRLMKNVSRGTPLQHGDLA